MDYLNTWIVAVVALLGWQVSTILGLILFDWVLAVALALQTKTFDLRKLADFMYTGIAPKLLAWLGAAIFTRFILPDFLPENLKLVGPGLEYVLFAVVVAALAGSVWGNLRAISGVSEMLKIEREVEDSTPEKEAPTP